MTDLVTFGETMLRYSPPTGRLETTDALDVYVGGAESNVAVAAARLGVDAAWLSKLPESPLARRIVGELRRHGVDPDVAWAEDGRVGTYYVEPGGEPRGTDVVYDREGAAVRTATTDELSVERVRDAEAFYASGITPALSDTLADTTRELLATARDAGTTTVFDVNYREKLWSATAAREAMDDLLDLVDVLVVAERDARDVLDRSGDPADVAASLADARDHETVVLTRGDRGALALSDGRVYEQPAVETEPLDPVGSGDAFVGGFLARRLDGGDVPEALEWGVATAALALTIVGDVAVVTPEEVAAVVADAGKNISR